MNCFSGCFVLGAVVDMYGLSILNSHINVGVKNSKNKEEAKLGL